MLQLQMEIETSGFFGDRIPKRFGGKKPSAAGRSDCSFDVFIRKLWFLYKLLTDVCFAYKEKGTRHRCSLSFKPNRITFLPSLLQSLMDVIASVKSLYEVRIIDVAILCENAHLKYFVFGDTTGPAKVSRVHCRCRAGLPVLVS